MDVHQLQGMSSGSSLELQSTSSSSGASEEPFLDRPSLQLQDVEGRIHKYEGLLSKKTKKMKLKGGWKKRWFRVIRGECTVLISWLSNPDVVFNS